MHVHASFPHGGAVLGKAMVKWRCDMHTAECIVLQQHKAQLRRPAPVAGQGPAHDVVAEVKQLQ